MFPSLCKSLFQNRIINGGNSEPLYLCSHLFRSISSSSSSTLNQNNNGSSSSFVVSYLMNSCGLAGKEALSASKKLNFKSTSNPDSVLTLLEDYGFTKPDISKLITKRPLFLMCNPHKILKPKLDYFNSKEVSRLDVVKVLTTNPDILARSLEELIIPFFDFIRNIVGTDQHTFAVLWRSRYIPVLHEKVMLNIQVLGDEGVPQSNVVKFLINHPTALMTSTVKLKDIVQEVKGMGFDPCKTAFLIAIYVIAAMTKSTWETKLNVYRKWGWSDDQILNAFKMQPICMMLSEKKICSAMDYFVNQMGYNSLIIAKCPQVLGFSLEKRIIPRCSVYQILVSKGLIDKDQSHISTLLGMPEDSFLRKFVIEYDVEAPELLKASIGHVLEVSQSDALILAAKQVVKT